MYMYIYVNKMYIYTYIIYIYIYCRDVINLLLGILKDKMSVLSPDVNLGHSLDKKIGGV